MIGRPTNVGMFFDPGIWAVITKNVPTSPRSFISGRATLNWLIVESSYVIAAAASLPSGHFVISVFGPSCAETETTASMQSRNLACLI